MKQPAIAAERQVIINYIQKFICFDHIGNGSCDHSACYALKSLQSDLLAGKHLGYGDDE